MLFNNYAGQYSAYDAPLVEKINQVTSRFGWSTFILSGIALVISLKKHFLRKITIFCVIAPIVTVGAFFHVQGMGIHHIYTIALELVVLEFLGVYQLMQVIAPGIKRISMILLIGVLFCLGIINCFVPQSRMYMKPLEKIFSQTYTSLYRNDIFELQRLAKCLNSLTENNNKHIYIDSSGGILNSSLMASMDKPYSNNAIHNMYRTHDVDLRDGFPEEFLKADYIVISDPIQLHLPTGTQEVVRFLAQEVVNHESPIGRHFTKLDEVFYLDNRVKVYIYQKNGDFESSDLVYLANYYEKRYPGMDSLFRKRILKGKN